MKMNEFLKKIAKDLKEDNRTLNSQDFYYILKYIGVKQDSSYYKEIEACYQEFLETLNNSLVRYEAKTLKSGENATNYISFYADKKARYEEAIKVYVPIKYPYMMSALKTIFVYLVRNNISCVVKFHEKSTNENLVIRFYDAKDVLPFIEYCDTSFILDNLLIDVNPFIATYKGMGIVRDDNSASTYNKTLSNLLAEYFKFHQNTDTLDLVSDLDFLDFVVKRKNGEENEVMLFNINAIEKNIKCLLLETSPLE